MSTITDGTKQNTKKLRFSLLSAFFNFVKNSLDPEGQNPCDNPPLRKLFRAGKPTQLKILEKDVVDEMIFRTRNPRNRLMLELMARSGMRVGEVLKLTPMDIEDRKAIIRDPKERKRGRSRVPATEGCGPAQNVYSGKQNQSDARIFPITYAAARLIVIKAGEIVGIRVRPHDLEGTLPHMRLDPVHRLKSCQRSYYAIRIYRRPRGILENK